MLNKKELTQIILVIVLMSLIINFTNLKRVITMEGLGIYLRMLAFSAIIILTSVFAKKFAAKKRGIEIEHKVWLFQRYGFYKRAQFKKPVPIGIILPIILAVISSGFIKCLAFLQFDSKALSSKESKRYGVKRYGEILESDLGFISFWGLVSVLVISLAANFLGLIEFAKIALFYSMWNLIPISQLDGIKILFGSASPRKESGIISPLYVFSWVITLIVLYIVVI